MWPERLHLAAECAVERCIVTHTHLRSEFLTGEQLSSTSITKESQRGRFVVQSCTSECIVHAVWCVRAPTIYTCCAHRQNLEIISVGNWVWTRRCRELALSSRRNSYKCSLLLLHGPCDVHCRGRIITSPYLSGSIRRKDCKFSR